MKGVYERSRYKEYALYKGDEFIKIGTVYELADYTGIPVSTIRFWSSKKWAERRKTNRSYIVVCAEEEDE